MILRPCEKQHKGERYMINASFLIAKPRWPSVSKLDCAAAIEVNIAGSMPHSIFFMRGKIRNTPA
jgi:hypothetical protein